MREDQMGPNALRLAEAPPLQAGHPLNGLWKKNLEAGLVEGVCRACSSKLGTLEAAKDQELALLDDMSGHPSMSAYRNKGYEIITF
jgi:hypothetical protein